MQVSDSTYQVGQNSTKAICTFPVSSYGPQTTAAPVVLGTFPCSKIFFHEFPFPATVCAKELSRDQNDQRTLLGVQIKSCGKTMNFLPISFPCFFWGVGGERVLASVLSPIQTIHFVFLSALLVIFHCRAVKCLLMTI